MSDVSKIKIGNDEYDIKDTVARRQIVDISGKADKVSGATNGDVATLDSNGNLVDSGKILGKSVPADAVFTDTNTKVTQTNTTGSADYRLVLSTNANDTTETNTARKSTNFKANPSTGVLSTPKVKISKSANALITGSGTAGSDKGSGVSPRYYPAKWTFNLGGNPDNGDIITIKIPVAGGTYSEWLSTDNGTTYHPIALNGKSRITSQYAVNTYLTLIYESSGVCTTYALAGADSTADVTGTWRVINYYDSNTTYSNMSQSEATTGTATTGRLITAKVLSDTISNKISGKADKVSNAANGNLAALDNNGNLMDSGKKASDFLTSHQTIKQDGITGATVNRFGTCSTGASTAAKTVSITSGTFSLAAGARVSVKFSNANTASTPTLNVGSTGAKNIYHKGSQITTGNNKGLLCGTVDFIYDGTQYHIIGADTVGMATDGSNASNSVIFSDAFTVGSRASGEPVGSRSVAQGDNTIASASNSHAEGLSTQANGLNAHAEGRNTTARGDNSHAEGYHTTAEYDNQHVSGKYNNNKSDTLFEIGNGTSTSARSNALEVYSNGDLNITGEYKKNGSVWTPNDPNISDAWVASHAYAVGDYCIEGGTLYKCKTAHTSAAAYKPPYASYWTAVKVGEELTALNSGLINRPFQIYGDGFVTSATIGSFSNPIIPDSGTVITLAPPVGENDTLIYFKVSNISSVALVTSNFYVSNKYNRVYLMELDSSGSIVTPWRVSYMTENVSGEVRDIYTFLSTDTNKEFQIWLQGGRATSNPSLKVAFM